MNNEPKTVVPKQAAAAVNLLAHPAAGVAALSAVGIGMASHAFGLWLGVIEAAAEASQRMLDQAKPVAPVAGSESKAAATKAQAATRILMEEAQSFAREAQADAEVKVAPAEVVPLKVAGIKAAPAKQMAPVDVAKAATQIAAEPAARLAVTQPKAMKKPPSPDDLKAISGIGPKLEAVLNGLGVWTYRQVAGWTSAEIGWVDDHLGFGGRIGRDDWTGQAKALAGGRTNI